jgi:hypothetical protein
MLLANFCWWISLIPLQMGERQMDLADQIATLAQRVVKLRDSIQTEEACKNAPFVGHG